MSHTKTSRNRSYSRLENLEEKYDYIRPIHVTWSHSNDNFEWILDRLQRRTLCDSGVWIRNQSDEILLVNEPEFSGWKEPNTEVRPTESFEAAAKRLATHLLDESVHIGSPIEIQIIKNIINLQDTDPIYGVIAIFEGAIDKSYQPVPMADGTADWFSTPPENTINEYVDNREF